jgi:hypothetical protein
LESEHSSVSVSAEGFGHRIITFNKTISTKTTATIFFITLNYGTKLAFADVVVNRINMCIYHSPFKSKRAAYRQLF